MQPSNRGEFEISEAIDLLIQSGRTIDAIGLEGWRIDVGYPEDQEEAEERLERHESAPRPDVPDAVTEALEFDEPDLDAVDVSSTVS